MEPQAESQPNDACLEPELWVDRHGDVLYRFALLRLRSPELAENAVQETFLAALAARDSFSGRSSERTWLVGILKRKVVDHFRKAGREVPTDDAEGAASDPGEELFDPKGRWRVPPARWGDRPGAELERAEFWAALSRCIQGLPERQARVFCLRELDELPGDEVCKVLGVSASNLWVLMHRARAGLRRCLELSWFEQQE